MYMQRFLVFMCTSIFFLLTVSTATGSPSRNEITTPQVSLPVIQIVKARVKSGDTASSLLNKYLPLKTIYDINSQSADVFSLRRIKKGQPYKIILQDGELTGFEYDIDKEERLVIHRKNKMFSIDLIPIDYEVDLEVVSSTISYSLFEAVKRSGERSELAWKLSDIFAWDIDFIRDIRPGDRFQVLVEKKYLDGKLSGYGKVHAAFFSNRGKLYKAFFHRDSNGMSGYYDENGNSLQKAFLKAPLTFSRISSKFSYKRMHPILKKYRSHQGVDYAAPMGTPIKTVGDGIITGIGYSKTMGNHVIVRHSNGYITRYYHMSNFAKSMRKNKKLIQGEIIGYVGMTGYATGPHLCFRMKKNGKSVDPLTHKLPSATPINPIELQQFLAKAEKLSQKMLTAPGAPVQLTKNLHSSVFLVK